MSLETNQQKLEQQKLEQAKQEKSSTPRDSLNSVYKLLAPENNQELTDNKSAQTIDNSSENNFITDIVEKLPEWRSQRENKESSEGTEGTSDTGRRSLDLVKEQLAPENNQSLDDNLDNPNVQPNQDISPEDSTPDDTELENQRQDIESNMNIAQHESTNAQVEAQNAQKEYEQANQEALEAEQKPDLELNTNWLKNRRDTAEKNAQAKFDKATEAEQNLQDLRKQFQELPKPKR
ncbi:hypothetical protein [Anabaena sp. PCC 7108]|uniref:hypothetical protein n=1 Tax=Anabaena sp. PCC 7108 TaxID=163908 RepID=UPI000346C57F|nr:hypothetical protein [Anabaena sp. PCC 7108]